MSPSLQRTIVLGLGSGLYSDAQVALRATQHLRNDPRLPAGIVVLYRPALGLEVLPELWDCARVVILTAVEAGAPPGTLVQLWGEQLRALDRNANRRHLGIASLYEALQLLAREPPQVTLFGVQAKSTSRESMLSSLVDRAIPTLIENVIAELKPKSYSATPPP
jgi:hydrogenase maturation protease